MMMAVKRGIDIIISFLGIAVLSPLWLLIGLLVKATSPGPILFCQERPGYHRKLFKVYKFRTMHPGSEQMTKGKEVLKMTRG